MPRFDVTSDKRKSRILWMSQFTYRFFYNLINSFRRMWKNYFVKRAGHWCALNDAKCSVSPLQQRDHSTSVGMQSEIFLQQATRLMPAVENNSINSHRYQARTWTAMRSLRERQCPFLVKGLQRIFCVARRQKSF